MKLLRLLTLLPLLAFSIAIAHAKPQLGLQSWTCRNMSFEELVAFAKKHGITQLELYGKHLDPKAPREENLRKRDILKQNGLTAYSIGVSGTTMNKEENRALFELAKLFDMKVIVVEPREPAQWDVLEELVKEYDIKLAIHNHGTGTVYGNPATVKQVLATRDPRIGVCMDIGWVTAAEFDAEVVFRNYYDRVFDMHLKDKRLDVVDGRNRPTDTHIGWGNSNYAGLFAAIKETKWSGVMAIETDSGEFAQDPTEFVTRAKAFFEKHFN
jgi:Sugar phosphate isomerases/epimerases